MNHLFFRKQVNFILSVFLLLSFVNFPLRAEETGLVAEPNEIPTEGVQALSYQTPLTLDELSESLWLSFTPEKAGEYYFHISYPESSIQATLYDASENWVSSTSSFDGENQYGMLALLEAGQTYYLNFYVYQTGSAPAEIFITENPIDYSSFSCTDALAYYGYGIERTESVETDEGYQEFPWVSYTKNPQSVSLKCAGELLTGNPDQVSYEIYNLTGIQSEFNIESDESYENQWQVGKHQVKLLLHGHSCSYEIDLKEDPVLSVKVPELVKVEYDCNTAFDGNPFDSNTKFYLRYVVNPAEGPVFHTVDGDFNSLEELQEHFHDQFVYNNFYELYTSDQSYENQWGVGDHTAYCNFPNHPVSYTVHVIKDPIAKAEIEDVTIAFGNYRMVEDWVYTDEGSYQVRYPQYDCYPEHTRVTTSSGSVYEGKLAEVLSKIEEEFGVYPAYRVITDQSYENTWKAGETHEVSIEFHNRHQWIPKVTYGYNVTIEDSPIQNVSVEDQVVYTGSAHVSREYVGEPIWNYKNVKRYNTQPAMITVTTADGELSGTIAQVNHEIYKKYGFYAKYEVTDDQSYFNQWEAGSHEAKLLFAGKEVTYKVEIKENPIKSVYVPKVIRYESDAKETFTTVGDATGNAIKDVKWHYYDATPDYLEVDTDQGYFMGSVSEIKKQLKDTFGYNIPITVETNQEYDAEWGIGEHPCKVYVGYAYGEYVTEVRKNPIRSVTVETLELTEDDAVLVNDVAEEGQTAWYCYDTKPLKVTVSTPYGEISGTPDEVKAALEEQFENCHFAYMVSDDQSYENQWEIGEHKAVFTLNEFQVEYKVLIKEGKTYEITLRSASQEYIYDGEEHVIEGFENEENGVITFTTTDGEKLEISGLTLRVSGTTVGEYMPEVLGEAKVVKENGRDISKRTVIIYETGKLTIVPREVMVTASNAEKEQGQNDPEFTATVTGLVEGEEPSLITYTIERAAGEEPGTYEIIPSGETLQGNYTVTYVNGTLTITAKADPANPFIDVSEDLGGTTYKAILWAYENGIIKGTSADTYSPSDHCTRAQLCVMLWRLKGKPAVNVSDNPFPDVTKELGNTTYKAILWAYQQGIVKGNADGTFNPSGDTTRANMAVMLWRTAGKPTVSATTNPFEDVSKSLGNTTYKSILWAYDVKLTKGTDKTHFSPNDPCTRAQLAVFLYRLNNLFHYLP